MFPGYVRSVDEAVLYLVDWVRLVGGWQVDGVDFEDQPGGGIDVEQFRVELTGGFVLTVSMTLRANLERGCQMVCVRGSTTQVGG